LRRSHLLQKISNQDSSDYHGRESGVARSINDINNGFVLGQNVTPNRHLQYKQHRGTALALPKDIDIISIITKRNTCDSGISDTQNSQPVPFKFTTVS
jgi:hypothetical protein